MAPSTHTDQDGKVIYVKPDSDLGVYPHQGNAEEVKKHIDENYVAGSNTSAG